MRYEDQTIEKQDYSHHDFSTSQILNTTFADCNFSLAHLKHTRLSGVTFKGCKLLGLKFFEIDKLLLRIRFENCQLTMCNFADLDLRQCQFIGCSLKECEFKECDMRKIAFEECDFSGCLFHHCKLQDTDFRDSKGYMIDLRTNQLRGAQFAYPEALSLLNLSR